MVDFVADGVGQHDDSDDLGGEELKGDDGGDDGFSGFSHAAGGVGGGLVAFNGVEPDQHHKTGHQSQVDETEEVVSFSAAGDAEFLGQDRTGQSGQAEVSD